MADVGKDYYQYVYLFPQYKKEFEVYRDPRTGIYIPDFCDNNNYFNLENFDNFKKNCKKIGDYFSELSDTKFNSNRAIRCKFMNYLINSDETYNEINGIDISDLMEAYQKLSKYKNICKTDINFIEKEILQDLTDLYNLYENYNRAQGGGCE
ncbi:unnamed protein product [Plasmodium vivax]|uniref:PIR Superfamily Protein n=2 Tax=Plasmodium vivax TaxID=5855 RepID=A0A0J9SKK2_PLAV1|nr:hypothetical protein PVBG_00614 [Plasmodium vivax Brazil I]CAG9485472.1 unnamed protein product [Plasmodium vivax]CAI7722583.1 hypothetical protein PVPAM_130008500 [Plasmodium vivax]